MYAPLIFRERSCGDGFTPTTRQISRETHADFAYKRYIYIYTLFQVQSFRHRNVQFASHWTHARYWWHEHRVHFNRIAVRTHANHVQRADDIFRPRRRRWRIFCGEIEVRREWPSRHWRSMDTSSIPNLIYRVIIALNNLRAHFNMTYYYILQTVRVEKPTTNGSTVIELQSPVTFSDLNALSKRDLIVTVEAKQSTFRLQGVVLPRVFCDVYQTLVVSSGHQMDEKKDRYTSQSYYISSTDFRFNCATIIVG